MKRLTERLETYIATQIVGAESIDVNNLNQIHGGGSRQTYRFIYRYQIGTEPYEQRAVLRMVPEAGGFTVEHMQHEWQIYQALTGTAVPVPRAIFHSDDPGILGGRGN